MNKEILRLLELIEILNKTPAIVEHFQEFASQFKADECLTIGELIETIESEMSYWKD